MSSLVPVRDVPRLGVRFPTGGAILAVVFVWGSGKAAANLKKHDVDFREAATVFDDPLSTTFPDVDHSTAERRFVIVGTSAPGRVLVVAYTEQRETVRIISARPATRRERTFYEEGS